ncbi:DUF1700 domain-containing protein [Bacillaceae bacterium SIJ1]|uniref:HAAS signaling domain-containing protein n=1 Tax=Litoribacterium kuwaitense TaxID=1398745 RepID=UPI0013EDAC14|nr:DUF1700 domain-containing protein [Litoribacterium kuwaitense]NGP46222.1 DUF1700 domain-containing protein [Litoribacterium kuwaitense]
MNRDQFMNALEAALAKLPESERHDVMHDFDEHFQVGLSEGKTEEEIAASLGAPTQIAREMVATHYVEIVDESGSTGSFFRALWAVIGLGFFNLVVVLGPFIAIASIVASGWAVGASFILSPLLVFINFFLNAASFLLFDLFFSIFLAGVGIFIVIGMLYVTKMLSKGFVRYLRFNVQMVKGGVKHG